MLSIFYSVPPSDENGSIITLLLFGKNERSLLSLSIRLRSREIYRFERRRVLLRGDLTGYGKSMDYR